MIRIGTAGWSLPGEWKDRFPEGESHLERYSGLLGACEINRTFKKMPRDATFERWAGTVPDAFRFSVKVHREISHDRRLQGTEEALASFLASVRHLGERLGPLLLQLPPSLDFDGDVAARFLEKLRERHDGPVALEARHASWFGAGAEELLRKWRVGRVAADPPRADADGSPGGHPDLAYFRLHGSPDTYYSAYRDGNGLETWAERVRAAAADAGEVWCIFDNTAAGEGTGDALALRDALGDG